MTAQRRRSPGHQVGKLTFVRPASGGWVCHCSGCGETSFVTHAVIHGRGHCGCQMRAPSDSDGEVPLSAIAREIGCTKQYVDRIQERAERKFRRNWTLWRLVMDTDLETADRPTLWAVVRACRILGAALDARRVS